jgi:hypothetical protein
MRIIIIDVYIPVRTKAKKQQKIITFEIIFVFDKVISG